MKHSTFAILFAFLFVACSINCSDAAETPSNLDTYYPLTPRTMTYDYLKKGSNAPITRQVTIQKSRIQDNVEVIPSTVSDPDLKFPITRFFQKTPDGIYGVASQIGEIFSKFDIKVPILKSPIKGGVFFDSDVKLSSSDGKFSVTTHYTYSIEDTNAVVSVPYGQFTNCIRMKVTMRGKEAVNEVTSWLAPKIGLVRSIEIMKPNQTNTVTETEMSLRKIDYNAPVEAARTPVGLEKKERGL